MSIRRFTASELLRALIATARRGDGDGLCWCNEAPDALDNHHDINCLMARLAVAMGNRDLGLKERKFVVIDKPWAYGVEIPQYYTEEDITHENSVWDLNIVTYGTRERFFQAQKEYLGTSAGQDNDL